MSGEGLLQFSLEHAINIAPDRLEEFTVSHTFNQIVWFALWWRTSATLYSLCSQSRIKEWAYLVLDNASGFI